MDGSNMLLIAGLLIRCKKKKTQMVVFTCSFPCKYQTFLLCAMLRSVKWVPVTRGDKKEKTKIWNASTPYCSSESGRSSVIKPRTYWVPSEIESCRLGLMHVYKTGLRSLMGVVWVVFFFPKVTCPSVFLPKRNMPFFSVSASWVNTKRQNAFLLFSSLVSWEDVLWKGDFHLLDALGYKA